jgi:hypothetical protein
MGPTAYWKICLIEINLAAHDAAASFAHFCGSSIM